jgi:hypothetical protein
MCTAYINDRLTAREAVSTLAVTPEADAMMADEMTVDTVPDVTETTGVSPTWLDWGYGQKRT